jgi:hypothetical protein
MRRAIGRYGSRAQTAGGLNEGWKHKSNAEILNEILSIGRE